MSKVALAAGIIEKRIANADHIVSGIPGERQLAVEMKLSRTTVRNAVQHLLDKGVLVRQENGRLGTAKTLNGTRCKRICFIFLIGRSGGTDEWQRSLLEVSKDLSPTTRVTIRSLSYSDWDDPLILEVLSNFDGAFLMSPARKLPDWLTERIRKSSCRVVVLDRDESAAGLPSVQLFPNIEHKMFELLFRLGHRRIDCIDTQEHDTAIDEGIEAWSSYLQCRDLGGQVRRLIKNCPAESAYQLVRDALQDGEPVATALFCTSEKCAIGTMRAIQEAGLIVGRDVSVCAINGQGLSRYLARSLTTIEAPHRALCLLQASTWILGEYQWQGPLLLRPSRSILIEGESTGPAHSWSIISATVINVDRNNIEDSENLIDLLITRHNRKGNIGLS